MFQVGIRNMTVRKTTRGLVLLAALVLAPVTLLFAQDAAPAKPKLPQMTVDLSEFSYPSDLQTQGVMGRVLVAFTINKRGVPTDPVVIDADANKEFNTLAQKIIKRVRFTVPDGWQDNGYNAYQFQMSVLFKLSPCVAPACVAPKPHEAADDFLLVGGRSPY